jgi:hypothetical protein
VCGIDSVCLDWLKSVKKMFCDNGICSSLNPIKKRHGQFVLVSNRYAEFYEQYYRWYPDGKEKRVPRDVDITNRDMLKNWVYGDGTLMKHGTLRLCTDSFSEEDVDFLAERLCGIGFGFSKMNFGISKTGKPKFRLKLCQRDGLAKFYEYLGSPDVYFAYKWR